MHLPVFRLHCIFNLTVTTLVSCFLFSFLASCTVLNQPESRLSFGARIETINEPTQNIYQNYPVIELDYKN